MGQTLYLYVYVSLLPESAVLMAGGRESDSESCLAKFESGLHRCEMTEGSHLDKVIKSGSVRRELYITPCSHHISHETRQL